MKGQTKGKTAAARGPRRREDCRLGRLTRARRSVDWAWPHAGSLPAQPWTGSCNNNSQGSAASRCRAHAFRLSGASGQPWIRPATKSGKSQSQRHAANPSQRGSTCRVIRCTCTRGITCQGPSHGWRRDIGCLQTLDLLVTLELESALTGIRNSSMGLRLCDSLWITQASEPRHRPWHVQ